MRRSRLLSCSSLFLQFVLAVPPLLAAQTKAPAPTSPQIKDDHADTPDSGVQRPAIFSVDVSLLPSGNLTVMANALNASEVEVIQVKAAVQEALECQLTDKSVRRQFPGDYYGSCPAPLSSSSRLLHQGTISTLPLQAFCRSHNIDRLSLSFHFSQADFVVTLPPAPENPFGAPGKFAATYRKFMSLSPSYSWTLADSIPPAIHYRFGFDPALVKLGYLMLSLALLLPLILCYWLGRKALSAQTSDKAVVWFSYMRSLQWVLNASLLGWWVALDESHLRAILDFLATGTRYAPILKHPAGYEVLSWIPPAIVWLICLYMSHPVQEQLRGLSWTRRELRLQALYSLLISLFPFALFLTGLRVMGTGNVRGGVYWFVAAFVLRLFAARCLLKLTGMQPHALSSGALRDRAFSFAEKLGVKLQEVFLIPSGKGQMANAFARTGNTISFTDFLLHRMSPREVDYVIAHELTHLKLKHPSKLGYTYLAGYFLGSTLIAFVPPAFASHLLFRYAFIFAGITVFPYFFARRFEYSADAGAVALTGDPRAAISALFKLSELNMMPTQWSHWSEKWLTHPSSLRRAHAIAQKAGIPVEEIPAIVRQGKTEAPCSSPESTATQITKIHSSHYKRSLVSKLSWLLIATLTLVPALFGRLAVHLQSFHLLQLIVLIAGIPGTFAAVLVLHNYVPRLTHGNLIALLQKKFGAQGVRLEEWGGIHVGFAPAAAPRTYETTFNWDLGYLFLRSDRICYWGEETQFALLRQQITAVKVSDAAPSFHPVKRIFIAWQDPENSTCGVFNIGARTSTSVLDANSKTYELAGRLQSWWQTPASARPLPPLLASLQSPKPVNITCAIPGSKLRGTKLVKELFLMGVLSGFTAIMLGLPFHLMAYLNASIYKQLGIASLFHSPGSGWYTVAVSVLIRFLILIPSLRYKDKPVLVAQSPSGQSSPSPTHSLSTQAPVSLP